MSGHKHFLSVPEAQEDGEVDVGVPGVGVPGVGVPGVGVVSDRSLEPSPLSPAWTEVHFGI